MVRYPPPFYNKVGQVKFKFFLFLFLAASLFDETSKKEKADILKGSAILDQKKNRRKANGCVNKRKMQQKQQVTSFSISNKSNIFTDNLHFNTIVM